MIVLEQVTVQGSRCCYNAIMTTVNVLLWLANSHFVNFFGKRTKDILAVIGSLRAIFCTFILVQREWTVCNVSLDDLLVLRKKMCL